MKDKMRRVGITAVGMLLIGSLALAGGLSRVQAQQGPRVPKPDKDTVETRGETGGQKKGGTEPANKKDGQVEKRQSPISCDVRFINTTRWYITRVYIDGRRVGSLARGYSVSTWYDEIVGPTELYAEADFTDGSTYHWGPTKLACTPNSTTTWTLQ
jgi:hypothetical protein